MATATRTHLTFQHDSKLHTLSTTVTSIISFSSLPEANQLLYKPGTSQDHVLITPATIFHPQGGGQPSDVGTISSPNSVFNVGAVRMDAIHDGQVLHFGRFKDPEHVFKEGEEVEQAIDVEKRLLYSRYHTAGHVLGAAVRSLLEKEVEGFDELKASHFPDSAGCEFQGLIEGKWKEGIQKRVDEFLGADMPVEIGWWDEEDFRKRGLERLIPERKLEEEEKWRVVEIVGAEVYPCGGTHVDATKACGETKVKKISRSKGTSRVSYTVS
jgi:Ser-tRNA(Ala) deacylase AlaX